MTPWLSSILTGQFLLVNEEDTKRIGTKLSMNIVIHKKSIFLPKKINSGKSEHLCGVLTTPLKISINTRQILLVTEEDTKKARTKQSIKMVERKNQAFLPSNRNSGKSAPLVVGMAATVEFV